ncbi:hypothetical protein J7295_04463 [Nakaseomyces glabratus]|nr:hypothetical protein J7298_04503 [Nakaseomyces glabratus]KAH7595240.1 hypothetical protein J7295_04463 [Nakaseomyces glabratus]KAH7611324.1 hypothetical protein J7292_04474 [Nakaseomyces glabratus]
MMEGQNISARNSSATAIYYGKIEDKGSKKKQNESFSFLDLEPVGPYFHFTHRSRWRRRGREGGSFKKTHNTHTHTKKKEIDEEDSILYSEVCATCKRKHQNLI